MQNTENCRLLKGYTSLYLLQYISLLHYPSNQKPLSSKDGLNNHQFLSFYDYIMAKKFSDKVTQ